MDMREHEANILKEDNFLALLEKSSVACTGISGGRVVCCGGVTPIGGKVADIWLIPSIYVGEYTIKFARHLRRWLFAVREDMTLVKMQTVCLDDDLHNGWMAFLGFEKDKYMEKYYNNNNYNMWCRTWA